MAVKQSFYRLPISWPVPTHAYRPRLWLFLISPRGKNKTGGHYALRTTHWNDEGIKKKKLQCYQKENSIYVGCIQEAHLTQANIFFTRWYKTLRQGRKTRPKRVLFTLVKTPAIDTGSSSKDDFDMEFLEIRLILPGNPGTIDIASSNIQL